MAKDKLGSAWEKEGNGKKYISVALDLGILGEVSCAVFEHTKRDASRNQPTHNLIFTPEKGKTKYVGAFWKKESKAGGEYLMGRIELKELGSIAVGGAAVDFSKVESAIDAKICRAANGGGKGPNYHVFRVAPAPKATSEGEEE